jgi:hypothetical protein
MQGFNQGGGGGGRGRGGGRGTFVLDNVTFFKEEAVVVITITLQSFHFATSTIILINK